LLGILCVYLSACSLVYQYHSQAINASGLCRQLFCSLGYLSAAGLLAGTRYAVVFVPVQMYALNGKRNVFVNGVVWLLL